MDTHGTSGTNNNRGMDFGGAFGGVPNNNSTAEQSINSSKTSGGLKLLDEMGGFGGSDTPNHSAKTLNLTALQDKNIVINFTCNKVRSTLSMHDSHNFLKEGDDTTSIQTSFNNNSGSAVTDLVFQVAVQKHLKLSLNPLTGTKLEPNSQGGVTQVDKILPISYLTLHHY